MQKLISFCYVMTSFLITATAVAQQDLDKTIIIDNIKRQYLIHLPPAFNATQKHPVIFALHGGKSSAEKAVKFYNFDTLADKNNCIIVYPNAIHAWNMSGISSRVKKLDKSIDDVKFIATLIDSIIANYNGDSKRVFCTGASRGGMFSLYLAYKLSDRITAIAPVIASISRTIADDYTFNHPTPVLLINGTDDPLVSYNGGAGKYNKSNEGKDDAAMLATDSLVSKIVALNKCNINPIVTNLHDTDPSDGCTAINYTYTGNSCSVEFIKVINGGHTWPGMSQPFGKEILGNVCNDFNASQKVMNFFMSIK